MTAVRDAIPLWDGVAPGSEDWKQVEREVQVPPPLDFTAVMNVVRPTLTPLLPDPASATGTGVLVCPGGAYRAVAISHEGFHVAEWFAAHGVAAFVLKYRVMESPDPSDAPAQMPNPTASASAQADGRRRMEEFSAIPLADGLAALALVRARLDEWGVRDGRLGAVGFSAGARLAMGLATQADPSVRPAFVGAIYCPDVAVAVPSDAPPLFLAVAADDGLFPGSVKLHEAWRQADRPVEAHFYGRGGHGFGMKKQGLPADMWIEQFYAWIASEGYLG
jgi:acetyl esterase/lipase